MKKIISLLLAIVMIGCMIPVSALADASSPTLEVSLVSPFGVLHKNQVAKARYTITSSDTMIGASAKLFINGVPVEGAGSDYFVLYGQNSECFDVVIPSDLSTAYMHTIGIEITAENGLVASCYEQFTLSPDAEDIQVKFETVPLEVQGTNELYYYLKFNLPVDFQAHMAVLRFSINGKPEPALDEKIYVSNGSEFCKMIPLEYVDVKNAYYVVDVTLNPGGDPALSHATATAKVPTINHKGNATGYYTGKIKPLIIPAQIMKDTNAYSYSSLTGYCTTIPAGTIVEYMNPDSSNSMRSAKIKTSDGSVYWVSMSNIYISREDFTIEDNLTDAEREAFVNSMGYESPTGYLIWVNKERQRLTVFMGSKGNWHAAKTFPVATGTNLTPTPTTVCTYEYSTRWVTATYTCSPVLSLYDGYAIHNQPVSHSGYITDTTIGKPASHGCIRMLQADVNWVYAYVPVKTTVVLY